ncbi:MAG TPA: peptide chain release factor N(5)-glutamine methyltransferase [Atribacterota bacterium]|nr:peptide chain release factor N(5)-glutamine methyltransferase [Atribacterota bacterium]
MSVPLLKKSTNPENEQCIGDLLSKGKLLLKRNGIENAEQESLLLLSYLLKMKKIDLLLKRHFPVSSIKAKRYWQWLRQRREGYPIQYITGFQNFMGLEFAVSKNVFIPRAETEILVEEVIKLIEMIPEEEPVSLMDIGAGCGVIPVAISSYFKEKGRHIDFHAVDLSSDALKLSFKNARRFHCQNNIHFHQGDLLKPFIKKEYFNAFHGIISNPPYISKTEWDSLSDEVRLFEPAMALLGGEKGVDFYKTIIEESPAFLKPGGFLALEIGHQQKDIVSEMIRGNGIFEKKIVTFYDYYHNDRGIIAFKKNLELK